MRACAPPKILKMRRTRSSKRTVKNPLTSLDLEAIMKQIERLRALAAEYRKLADETADAANREGWRRTAEFLETEAAHGERALTGFTPNLREQRHPN
jgi:hypothetical protein